MPLRWIWLVPLSPGERGQLTRLLGRPLAHHSAGPAA
jgi:hypothetical protein